MSDLPAGEGVPVNKALGLVLLSLLSIRESPSWGGEEGPQGDPLPIRDKTASHILSRAVRVGGNVIRARGQGQCWPTASDRGPPGSEAAQSLDPSSPS